MKVEKHDGDRIFQPHGRDIMYAAHRDAWIYRYYGYLLNEKYNSYMMNLHLNEVSLAYRTNFLVNRQLILHMKLFNLLKIQRVVI